MQAFVSEFGFVLSCFQLLKYSKTQACIPTFFLDLLLNFETVLLINQNPDFWLMPAARTLVSLEHMGPQAAVS